MAKGECTCWNDYPNICHKRYIAKRNQFVWKCVESYRYVGETSRGKTKCVRKDDVEQGASKLNNHCDSLLTDDSEGSKERKSKLDLISRADAISVLIRWLSGEGGDIIEQIESLPSASAEAVRWIPCGERLPAYGEKCLVTFALNSSNYKKVAVSYCYVQKEGFWSDTGRDYKAVAWMPLPKPYCGAQMDSAKPAGDNIK